MQEFILNLITILLETGILKQFPGANDMDFSDRLSIDQTLCYLFASPS